ncbi:MAG: aminotransferase class I/II-fold pyridoxal phosphate-dependent enzyme [Chloroflexi bacterium]|nr:aminotransferase class I/II-fold pyridoxal phosphate-dependent enzyme [Chloroflexota bacterium]
MSATPVAVKGRSRVSQRVADIPPSGIRRFFDIIASTEGIISLGVGEPDFITPWHIREAAIYGIERGHTHYTSNLGTIELRRELVANLERLYGLRYDPTTEILVTVGVSEALDLALRAVIDPGDEVVTAEPGYVAYFPVVHLAGGRYVPVPTRMEDEFRLRREDVEQVLTPKTRVLLINNPANPTGAVLDRATGEALASLAEERDLIVLADEIYDRLVYNPDEGHLSFPSLPGMKERTVLLGGLSKAYAMTGWRVGYAAGPADIIAAMTKVHQYTMMSAPTVAQEAAVEALRNGEVDVQAMLEAYGQRRRILVNGLRSIGLPCVDPGGAFYAFPSILPTGLTSEEFAERLLLEEKVAVVPGNAFGASGEGFVRCCYAASVDDIEEALERMSRFVARYRGATGKTKP